MSNPTKEYNCHFPRECASPSSCKGAFMTSPLVLGSPDARTGVLRSCSPLDVVFPVSALCLSSRLRSCSPRAGARSRSRSPRAGAATGARSRSRSSSPTLSLQGPRRAGWQPEDDAGCQPDWMDIGNLGPGRRTGRTRKCRARSRGRHRDCHHERRPDLGTATFPAAASSGGTFGV